MNSQLTADLELAQRLIALRPGPVAPLPTPSSVADFADEVLACLFPQLSSVSLTEVRDVAEQVAGVRRALTGLLETVVSAECVAPLCDEFIGQMEAVYDSIRLDAEAIAAGDPAAQSLDEVVTAYPGFQAAGIHRIAHRLHRAGVPLLPRLLAELAHRRTGIDIHPGAQIGRSLWIDHGTGVVIGETATVGNDVQIFQGVTLGALSASKSFAGVKRHPTIEDRVVLYANATILGGDTVIGHDSVIGGNVWLTTSVAPHSFVHQTSQVRVRRAEDLRQPSDYSI